MEVSVIRIRPNRNDLAHALAITLMANGVGASMASAQDNATGSGSEPGGGQIEEILVSGSPINRDPFDLLQGSSILQDQELDRRLAGTIGETLTSLPGVNSNYFAPGASRPVIRGQGGPRVRMLVNGLGAFDASTASPDHAVAAETLTTEKVEVLRGPAALLYGSNAAGGVVNVIDRRLPRQAPEGGFNSEIMGTFGTAANERAVSGAVDAAIGDHLVVHADGSYRNTDNLEIPGFAESERLRAEEEEEEHDSDHDVDHDVDHENEGEEEEAFGILPNSDVENWTGNFGASYVDDRGYFGVSVGLIENEYGVGDEHGHDNDHDVDHENEAEFEGEEEEEGPIRIDMKQYRAEFGGAREFDGFVRNAEFRLGYADYRHFEQAGDEIETRFDNEAWEGRLELEQRNLGPLEGAYGFQFRSRDFGSEGGEEAFIPPTETFQWGLFGLQKVEWDKIHLEYGGRIERQSVELSASSEERDFTAVSGSVGLAYHPNEDYLLGVNLSRTERAPIAEELFSNGPHFATGAFEIGDSSLGTETGWTIESSVRKRAGRLTGSLSVFYTDYSGFIFLDPTGEEEDELPVFVYTQLPADFYGGEAQLDFLAWQEGQHSVSLDLTADLVRTSSSQGPLPRIPPASLLGGIEYSHALFDARIEAKWFDDQTRIAEFETPTDGYTWINFHLTVRPLPNNPATLTFKALNLTDKTARNHVSFRKDRVPMQGRDFQLTLRIPI